MLRLLLLAALVVVLTQGSCPHPHPYPDDEEEILPLDGTWALDLETRERTGPCQDVDIQVLGSATPVLTLAHLGEGRLAMDLDGAHLDGWVVGSSLSAEGFAPDGFLRHHPSGIRRAVHIAMDGQIDEPERMRGDMTLVLPADEGDCVLELGYFARWDPALYPDRLEPDEVEPILGTI